VHDQQPLESPSFLAEFRQTMLREAAGVLLEPATNDDRHRIDNYPRLAGMLASALEQLRVADDELQRRDAAAAASRAEWLERTTQERLLFDAAPAVLLVTDTAGTILEANAAGRELLGGTADQLTLAPLSEFLPRENRNAFRNGLTHVLATNRVDDWRLRLMRRRNVPADVVATVAVVPDGNRRAKTAALFWCLRPEPSAD
jgi:PAS domain S-box-containing protein